MRQTALQHDTGTAKMRTPRPYATLHGVNRLAAVLIFAFLACALLCVSACSSDSGAAVRDSVGDYTWAELSQISDQIAAADDDDAAIEIAKRYHLANDDGTLDGTQRKTVELADGSQVDVLVAGFCRDEKAGGGKAGITFIFANAVAQRAMNNNAGFDELSESDFCDVEGGWTASEMRQWLNATFACELPADLRAELADVAKTSIAIPGALAPVGDGDIAVYSDETLLGVGVDKLWLPSVAEVGDPSEDAQAVAERPDWSSVVQAEGERYQLFADDGNEGSLDALRVRSLISGNGDGSPCRWWLRSAEETTFSDVREDGSLDRMQDELAAHPLGVVPCFAL